MDLRALRYFVTVAEERHVGRAAVRLHMTQPPLSRAIRNLEKDLGVRLFDRTPKGVGLTPAGKTLYDEARALLAQADRVRARVTGAGRLSVGTLADTAEQVGRSVVELFRRRHPGVTVDIHEVDLGDPTAGLRAGLVDVALTRSPFDDSGLGTRVLRSDAVGVVLRDDDPLARRKTVAPVELAARPGVRLPDHTDPLWTDYWTSGPPAEDAPVVRTIQECLQSVLWNGSAALAPVGQPLPPGLVLVPLTGRPPSDLVVAWRKTNEGPLVRAFAESATA
ncbi:MULTISPECIES: LysR family transcriptional regulator [Amycolatopsis]|uniref:DNA-binding transcriptional regulator, LysR family n=2 Tax=Amycolatopsis TaxID=1813 RepID=A0A1I4AMA8_9PSEU|nr:LysR substrate-binding domain-containing protein [Amycolatopsis sacchari]SFK57638.1 DNA-binding transcriptional regulator, LysR family [Amycolatopsis sacchari]